jgi:hypothetical protein
MKLIELHILQSFPVSCLNPDDVGTVNRRTRDRVLEYVQRNAKDMSLLILTTEPNCQGFKIERWGEPDRRDTEISGLWLVAEQWVDEENRPF